MLLQQCDRYERQANSGHAEKIRQHKRYMKKLAWELFGMPTHKVRLLSNEEKYKCYVDIGNWKQRRSRRNRDRVF